MQLKAPIRVPAGTPGTPSGHPKQTLSPYTTLTNICPYSGKTPTEQARWGWPDDGQPPFWRGATVPVRVTHERRCRESFNSTDVTSTHHRGRPEASRTGRWGAGRRGGREVTRTGERAAGRLRRPAAPANRGPAGRPAPAAAPIPGRLGADLPGRVWTGGPGRVAAEGSGRKERRKCSR